jgi:SGNH hydrolase-like domain, acetyltransferase AlgX
MNILSPSEIRKGVLGGLDNYLYLFDGAHHQFSYLVGDLLPSTESIANFFGNLDHRHRYCEQRGIAYLHVVFPSKPVVTTEKLPSPWRERVQSLFLGAYATTLGAVWPSSLCYPRDLLLQLDAERPAFYPLDTHMSNYGSLSVARWILQKLGLDYDPAEIFTESAGVFTGDLARMLGSSSTLPGTLIRPLISPLRFSNLTALPGNANHMVVMHNPYASSERRLLVFGDSFMDAGLQYLAPCFRDIVFVRIATFQADLVELVAPDVVITSNAERYLANVKSDCDSSPILMALHGLPSYKPTAEFREALTAQLSWRYHHSVYKHWQEKQPLFEMAPLGACRANAEIEILDANKVRFRSLGNDPYFTLLRVPLVSGRHYLLQLSMRSEVASLATVYYQDEVGMPFVQSRTVRLPVVEGDNELCFLLDSAKLGPSLRLDPLCCPGSFSITNITLIEQPPATI